MSEITFRDNQYSIIDILNILYLISLTDQTWCLTWVLDQFANKIQKRDPISRTKKSRSLQNLPFKKAGHTWPTAHDPCIACYYSFRLKMSKFLGTLIWLLISADWCFDGNITESVWIVHIDHLSVSERILKIVVSGSGSGREWNIPWLIHRLTVLT